MSQPDFVVIGENIHATRVLLRNGRRVGPDPAGAEAVSYGGAGALVRYLRLPDWIKQTQDYAEGRVKHVQIAIRAAMSGEEAQQSSEGMAYLEHMVRRQEKAGAHLLDLNVDEISLKPQAQKEAMQWLVSTVQGMTSLPVSVDSSNMDTLEAGLSGARSDGRTLLNSASLERIDALDLALAAKARVIVTAAGESGMPESAEGRLANAIRVTDAALDRGIAIQDIFIDPLVFPIAVDTTFGHHCLEAIRGLRKHYGQEIHITGGFSNVSFGMPSRRLINDVFLVLATEAGADSGILDPVASKMQRVFTMDRASPAYQLAEDLLLDRDRRCKTFLKAHRSRELKYG